MVWRPLSDLFFASISESQILLQVARALALALVRMALSSGQTQARWRFGNFARRTT
jgi:hypothetical protein